MSYIQYTSQYCFTHALGYLVQKGILLDKRKNCSNSSVNALQLQRRNFGANALQLLQSGTKLSILTWITYSASNPIIDHEFSSGCEGDVDLLMVWRRDGEWRVCAIFRWAVSWQDGMPYVDWYQMNY